MAYCKGVIKMNNNYSVVNMQKQHIDGVFKLYCDNFVEKWSKKSIEQEIDNKLSKTLVLLDGKEVIGFVNARHILFEGDITNIAISKEYCGKKLGMLLMKHLINLAKSEGIERYMLEVRKSNIVAIRFYEKIGFIKVGERKNYYNNPLEDAILYDLKIL